MELAKILFGCFRGRLDNKVATAAELWCGCQCVVNEIEATLVVIVCSATFGHWGENVILWERVWSINTTFEQGGVRHVGGRLGAQTETLGRPAMLVVRSAPRSTFGNPYYSVYPSTLTG